MKKLLALLLLLTFSTSFAQLSRPKLVVGIVVDQMRPDYLTRFYDQFGEGGFKLLMKNGYTLWNVHFNYIPTYTGPGHASLYSGTTPRYHGIIGNDIYDRETGRAEYCTKDSSCYTVGNPSKEKMRGMSPHKLIVTNICDELKLCTNRQSKVLSLSLKDRAAILTGGHLADYAIWLDLGTGNFVTSSFYAKQLPGWVTLFNSQNYAASYIKEAWKPLHGDEYYTNCVIDTSIYAFNRRGVKYLPLFPHTLSVPENSKEAKYSMLYRSPFANSLLTDLAIAAIRNGELGKGENPDFLAVSFSSTDMVGHLYGPQSKELKDTYLRLDSDLERLIKALDQSIGKENYVLFLTADHGSPDISQFLMKLRVPGGYIDHEGLYKAAAAFLDKQLSPGRWIDTLINDQFYLNHRLVEKRGEQLARVQRVLADFLVQQKGIAFAYTATQLNESEFNAKIAMAVQNGFQPKMSGDVVMVMESGYFEHADEYLTEHGSPYNYDTNVPLIWYGQNIRKGESWKLHYIPDLAATLSMILRVKYPSACIGNPIDEIRER